MAITGEWPTALLALSLLAGCASAPEPTATDEATIYVDAQTGEVVYPNDNPSDEELAIGALLGALTGVLAPEALEEDEILNVDSSGNVTHIQSGLSCPKTWSQLFLQDKQIYKQDGQDVGCSYQDGDGVFLTLYAYRSNMTVDDELNAIMDQVVKARHPIHESAGILNLTEAGTSVRYEADAIIFKGGDGRLMKSGLALADYAGWRMKARVTYPEAVADEFERFLTVVMLSEFDQISARQKQLEAISGDAGDDL